MRNFNLSLPRVLRIATTLGAFVVLPSCLRAQQPFFMGLGDLPGGDFESRAYDLSADGAVVTGWSVVQGSVSNSYVADAFRWTRETGMVALGALTTYNEVRVSNDGATVVGNVGNGLPQTQVAFRWTAEKGVEYLPIEYARGVSGDGAIIVGQSGGGTNAGYQWSEAGGLKPLFGGDVDRRAWDVSADATVIAVRGGPTLGAVWTAAGGVEFIQPPVGQSSFLPWIVSDAGITIVGESIDASDNRRAARWTAAEGASLLPLPTDGRIPTRASGASADGSVVVGRLGLGFLGNTDAFIWDAATGTRSLSQLLVEEYGLGNALAGWQLATPTISGDGRTIAGAGYNPAGKLEAWVAYLGPQDVPEPSALALAGTALVILRQLHLVSRNSRVRRGS